MQFQVPGTGVGYEAYFLQVERVWGGMLDGANSPDMQFTQDMEVSLP